MACHRIGGEGLFIVVLLLPRIIMMSQDALRSERQSRAYSEKGLQALPARGCISMEREILVVEDDIDLNQLVGAYAEIAGYRYRSALNGKAALEEVRAQQCSLIVLDIMLPDMD